jgi:hypothetical protein
MSSANSHISYWRMWLHLVMFPLALIAISSPGVAATFCEQGANAGIASSPITFSGYVITDVTLGSHKRHNAQVTISFRGDARDIHAFEIATPDGVVASGFCIDRGTTTVEIAAGEEHEVATFDPGQVLVSYDKQNDGIGFSSYIGPNGLEPAYPLAFDEGTVGFSRDIWKPAAMSGKAWSCIGYPPLFGSGHCSDPDSHPLKTDHGKFIIYNPYLRLDADGTISSDHGGTLNRGLFSIAVDTKDR